jgi:hypothetical protein
VTARTVLNDMEAPLGVGSGMTTADPSSVGTDLEEKRSSSPRRR